MLQLIAGCLAVLASGLGLGVAASCIAAPFRAGASRGERVGDQLLVTTSLAIALVQGLGFAGLLRPWIVFGACSSGLGLLLTAAGRESGLQVARDLAAGFGAAKRSVPLAAAAALGFLLAVRGLRLPELSWDGLTYHLTYPAAWLKAGGFVRFEAGGVWEQYESFPKGGEALFFLALLPFHADHFVNWVNLPLWAGVACTLRAALLRMECSRATADLCALLAVTCPALSAYATITYVEVPVAFALCAALAAATRALRARDARALAPLWLALCLGAAFKVTALAYLPAGVLVTLFAMRSLEPATCVRPALYGVALGCVVAAPWYVHNWVQCQNPLYPSAVLDFPGTIANVWAVRETSVLSQGALPDILELLSRAPWRVRYPLGPGWLVIYALPACIVASVGLWLRDRRSPHARAAMVFLSIALASCIVYLVSPWNGVFREANTRFLMPTAIAAGASLALAVQAGPRWRRITLAAIGCSIVALSLVRAQFIRNAFGPAISRLDAYDHVADLHPGAREAALWRYVEALPPSRIALTVGDVNATEGWFFYPLFGSRLQHSVQYVDIESDAAPACVRRGLIRDQPNEVAWRNRLREQSIDYLVVAGSPTENGWVRAHPETFQPVFQHATTMMYRVR